MPCLNSYSCRQSDVTVMSTSNFFEFVNNLHDKRIPDMSSLSNLLQENSVFRKKIQRKMCSEPFMIEARQNENMCQQWEQL